MSRNAYENEKRRERDAAYEAQCIERARLEDEHEQRFGALRDRLEELGINHAVGKNHGMGNAPGQSLIMPAEPADEEEADQIAERIIGLLVAQAGRD